MRVEWWWGGGQHTGPELHNSFLVFHQAAQILEQILRIEDYCLFSLTVPLFLTRMIYDMIYLLTAIGLSPGGSTHLHTNTT
jgi:hypothetical protein